MSKYKCTRYEKEMLEMYSKGKSTAEIVEIFNTRFSDLGLTESYVRGAIKRYKGKQNENEQAKMFSENQERIHNKENSMQKKGVDKQKNSEAKKMKESGKALIEAQIKSFSRLTKELHNTFVIFSAINEEFGKAIEALQERNRKNKIKYLLLGGLSFMVLAIAMIIGYHYSHPGEDMSFLYISLLKNAGLAMLLGLGLGLILNKKS